MKIIIKKTIQFSFIVMAAALLCSCAKPVKYPVCSAQWNWQVKQSIRHNHGQYVVIGDHSYLSFPSESLFDGNSANLTPNGQKMLTNTAKFLTCKANWASQVTVYNDAFASKRANIELARQQGNVVLSLLWQHSRMSVASAKGVIAKCGCGNRLNVVEIVTTH